MPLADLVGAFVGFLFTLLVFSYIFRDNFLFRATIHLFIGVSAGFAGGVALRNVIIPNLFLPLMDAVSRGSSIEVFLSLFPLLLSVLLLAKLSTRLGRLGNISMAYLVGVGAATAIGGSILGTLLPQIGATSALFNFRSVQTGGAQLGEQLLFFLERPIALFGTLATLVYFQFGAKQNPDGTPQRSRWLEIVSSIGQGFIAITFGVLFAGVYAAALTALIERAYFVWQFISNFL